MRSINLFLTLPIIYSFSVSAAQVHEDAKKREWGKMFTLIKAQPAMLNELEEGTGNTVLDIALRMAPTDVVQALIRIGGQPGVMIEMEPELAIPQVEAEPFAETLNDMLDKYGEDKSENDASSGEWPVEMETPGAVAPYTERDPPKSRHIYAHDTEDDLDVSKILNFDSGLH